MPPAPVSVMSALARDLAADPGRPLVTYYDEASAERIELSVTTFANWANKIANLLGDELMIEPGAGVRIDLPPHWQATVAIVGAWTAGLVVVLPGATTRVAASVVGPDASRDPSRVEGQVVACSLRPLGGRFVEPLPDGWLDFALEVPSQPDLLLAPSPAGPGDVAVDAASGPVTHAELVELGRSAMAQLGVGPGGRLITDADPSRAGGLAPALVGPLVTSSSVVLLANVAAASRARIAGQERATASLWLSP